LENLKITSKAGIITTEVVLIVTVILI